MLLFLCRFQTTSRLPEIYIIYLVDICHVALTCELCVINITMNDTMIYHITISTLKFLISSSSLNIMTIWTINSRIEVHFHANVIYKWDVKNNWFKNNPIRNIYIHIAFWDTLYIKPHLYWSTSLEKLLNNMRI